MNRSSRRRWIRGCGQCAARAGLDAARLWSLMTNAGSAIVVYGGLGFIGLKLSQKLGSPDLWDSSISNSQRLLVPTLLGGGIGLFFIGADMRFNQLHTLGPLPHPPFPTSLVVSAIAAIGEEIIFRLFLVSFLVWLASFVILRKRWQNQVFGLQPSSQRLHLPWATYPRS